MPVPSQRQPRHPHSLSQFTGPRRFEHGNSSRKKRQDAPCNLALISATGFLVPFTPICSRFRDHKKNDRFPDSSNTRYSPSSYVYAFSKFGTTPSSILSAPRPGYRGVRACCKTRQVELTFPQKLETRRASGSSRRLSARQNYSVKVLADQFSPDPLRSDGL